MPNQLHAFKKPIIRIFISYYGSLLFYIISYFFNICFINLILIKTYETQATIFCFY